MVNVLHFYMDDSGTRNPDHKPGKQAAHGYDWFALGGILVKKEHETEAKRLHEEFCREWKINYPLHSAEIRGRNENFLWLEKRPPEQREKFSEALYQMMKSAPVLGLAAVIDRRGYNARYAGKYGKQRWLLCKTAFSIAVERAAKFASLIGYKLRVMPERCNKREDCILERYYNELRTVGMHFAPDSSGKYAPLPVAKLSETLYEFQIKNNTSPLVQLADLFLWPICMGGYDARNRPYQRLRDDGKLIECALPENEWASLGTKYSCFENVKRRP